MVFEIGRVLSSVNVDEGVIVQAPSPVPQSEPEPSIEVIEELRIPGLEPVKAEELAQGIAEEEEGSDELRIPQIEAEPPEDLVE